MKYYPDPDFIPFDEAVKLLKARAKVTNVKIVELARLGILNAYVRPNDVIPLRRICTRFREVIRKPYLGRDGEGLLSTPLSKTHCYIKQKRVFHPSTIRFYESGITIANKQKGSDWIKDLLRRYEENKNIYADPLEHLVPDEDIIQYYNEIPGIIIDAGSLFSIMESKIPDSPYFYVPESSLCYTYISTNINSMLDYLLRDIVLDKYFRITDLTFSNGFNRSISVSCTDGSDQLKSGRDIDKDYTSVTVTPRYRNHLPNAPIQIPIELGLPLTYKLNSLSGPAIIATIELGADLFNDSAKDEDDEELNPINCDNITLNSYTDKLTGFNSLGLETLSSELPKDLVSYILGVEKYLALEFLRLLGKYKANLDYEMNSSELLFCNRLISYLSSRDVWVPALGEQKYKSINTGNLYFTRTDLDQAVELVNSENCTIFETVIENKNIQHVLFRFRTLQLFVRDILNQTVKPTQSRNSGSREGIKNSIERTSTHYSNDRILSHLRPLLGYKKTDLDLDIAYSDMLDKLLKYSDEEQFIYPQSKMKTK